MTTQPEYHAWRKQFMAERGHPPTAYEAWTAALAPPTHERAAPAPEPVGPAGCDMEKRWATLFGDIEDEQIRSLWQTTDTGDIEDDILTFARAVVEFAEPIIAARVLAEQMGEAKGQIEHLDAENHRMRENAKMFGRIIHDMVVANQAAWIEWQHGNGAEAAMIWVHNGLAGPGQIPDESEPYGKEPQAWYDANNADPLPKCECGRPSNIGWMGKGFCCNEHYRTARAASLWRSAESKDGAA